jgi:translocation and assembly module TamB
MRRKFVYIILAAPVIAVLLLLVLSAWILGTSKGAEWLISAVSKLTPVEISADHVHGRLWDTIEMRELQITWSNGNFRAGVLHLNWQPLYLLTGNVAVTELSVKDLELVDNSPEKETDLKWPEISRLLALFDGWIDFFKVDSLSLRRQNREPLVFRNVSLGVIWQERRLTLKDFSIAFTQGDANGTVVAGFRKPFLSADIMVHPLRPVYGMTALTMKINLTSAAEPLQVKGPVSIVGSDGLKDRMNINAEIGLKRYAVMIQKMLFSESGRRGSVTGEGEIDFRSKHPDIKAAIRLNDYDLSLELKTTTHLEGSMILEGNIDDYSGTLKLSNSGEKWRSAELLGSFRGDKKGVDFLLSDGYWLHGNLRGEIKGSWEKGVSVSAELRARNIDPAAVDPSWKGVVNFDVSGKMIFPEEGQTTGELSGRILKSMLHGKALTGEVEMNMGGKNLILKKLFLHGKGFDISAKGDLRKRLTFFANITDLSGLVPDAQGSFQAEGWMVIGDRFKVAGTIRGKDIAVGNIAVKGINLKAGFREDKKTSISIKGDIKGIRYHNIVMRSVQAEISGSEEQHVLSLSIDSNQWSMHTLISGAYREKSWSGKIIELYGHDTVGAFKTDKQTNFSVSAKKISVSDFSVVGVGPERLSVNLQVDLYPTNGFVRLDWTGLNLARSNQWMETAMLEGKTSGKMNMEWARNDLTQLLGAVEASGMVRVDDQHIKVEKTFLNIDWNTHGLTAVLDMQMKKHGMIKGEITAEQPVRLGLPDRADIDIRLSQMDTATLQTLLPKEIKMQGILSAQVHGKLLPGRRTDISGSVEISGGIVEHASERGELRAELRSAQVFFVWQGEKLSGNLELSLADYGNLKGNFSLPVPARLPISLRKDGPINVSIKGTAQEKGILTTLFPGLVQESHGKLKLDLAISGSWNEPIYSGNAELTDAGAYLPPAGITLKGVTATALFNRTEIIIKTFSAKSGKGVINGNAKIKIKQFRLTEYDGMIRGENFQAIYLPELQVAISPDLTFEGNNSKTSVRGQIQVPELFAYKSETKVIGPSMDVIIIDSKKKQEQKIPLNLDISVRVILGKQVFVKMEGIDAQLKGAIDLKATGMEEIRASGSIEVVKGKYKKYGIDLDIKRGKAVFAGGPADNPSLDILALREIDDVKAGILAIGTLQSPVVKLYSEPPMPDTDILSYIVLGHPPGADSEQISLLSHAAGLLLSGGESATLQAKLQQRLGLDVLDIESGSGEIARSMLTVGKYLSPRLYVGYGVSLFTGQNILRLKYKLSKRFQLQTESGLETGIDLFYKIEFK